MNVQRSPYKKTRAFKPAPIRDNGIPRYADSILNPKCVGTPDHQKFWEEELRRILSGYTTGGITIPGRYYYYLNYKKFNVVSGEMYADMCDLHLELAYLIDWCKANGKNFICPKGRRKGLSEAGTSMIVDYGYRFHFAYNAGVAAGLADYVEDFMKKWTGLDSSLVPEFKLKNVDNKDIKTAQYKIKEPTGIVKAGTMNNIYMRTCFNNPNMFKGLHLNDIIAEECGEFDLIKPFYRASEEDMKRGSKQYGNFWAWGTGGSMKGASKFFEEMWHEHETYNMIRFFVDARRFYFPFYGGAKENGKVVEEVPNLVNWTLEERYGVEDVKAAEDFILKERKRLLESGDTEAYIEFCQNTPLDIKEVFRRSTSDHFDINILNDRGHELESSKPRYTKYKLKFKTTPKGELLTPLEVELIPATDEVDESECVLISDDGHYEKNSSRLYCAGVDSYDLDKSKTSKSLGAMCVRIRDNDFAGKPKNKPVAVIRCRPKKKEIFYDMCMMLSVYYNLVGATLIDVRNGVIIKHFEENRCKKYLAKRPKKFESDNSEQVHEFGVSLNKFSKPRMISLMQSDVATNGKKFDFLKLIDELKNYDEIETDSDNDLADAYGICLMQDVSMESKPLNDEEAHQRESKFSLNDWENSSELNWGTTDHENFGQ